ncbi:NAD(P)H-binding protein [Bacillus salacetis]|uniref:NAD(P)H-binding protein n=1 Tax=Bacillus salacetis TaxID=2315464 RepID=UPI003B9E2755
MSILVTGFTGKVGFQVAQALNDHQAKFVCGVRNVEKASSEYGSRYDFTGLDFSDPSTFTEALKGVEKIFLMYPPGDQMEFDQFIHRAKAAGVNHIVYLSVKDVQFMPFIHHFKWKS